MTNNSSIAAAVIAGLAAGIAFVLLFSTFFAQAHTPLFPEGEYHPRPGRIADHAVKIAMKDSTIQQLFEGREIAVASVRDWGVAAGSECPIGWCAIILFDDNSDDITGFASVTVNVKWAKVMDFSLHKDILIQRANDTKEAKYFVSKYPDAQVDVIRDRTTASVSYSVTRQVGESPDSIERKRVLAIFFDKVNLMTESSEFRLYCIDGLSTPAVGGDILGRIDDEGCFGIS